MGHLFTFADFSVRGPLNIIQEVCQSGQMEMKNLPSFEAWEAGNGRYLLRVRRLGLSEINGYTCTVAGVVDIHFGDPLAMYIERYADNGKGCTHWKEHVTGCSAVGFRL